MSADKTALRLERWGLFIGEGSRLDPEIVVGRTPTASVLLPGEADGQALSSELKRRYPGLRTCLSETLVKGGWLGLSFAHAHELQHEKEKVIWISRVLWDIDDYAHFALVYTGDSPPARFPSEPSLIVFYHPTTRASPVLEVLNQAAPGHQFMVRQPVAESGEFEWQDLNWTDGLPPAPLHVWMVARKDSRFLQEETIIDLPTAAKIPRATMTCHMPLVHGNSASSLSQRRACKS